MSPQDIKRIQDEIAAALARNPDIGNNDPTAILDAYTTGDWSGIVSLSGQPFTPEQQQAAVAKADEALAPAYREQEALDRSQTEDALRQTQEGFDDFQTAERRGFASDKEAMDQDAADRGVLFSGSRVQKLNDLRNTYADREAIQRRSTADSLGATARGYQYQYGNDAARGLSEMYSLPGATRFNSNTGASGRGGLSSVYDPSKFNFQGRSPVAQKAAVQTRAAGYLANRANKLTTSGIGSKF